MTRDQRKIFLFQQFLILEIFLRHKKRISLTEHYKNDTAALKHVLDFQNGPYQETFFKLMKVNSFQVMGPASEELMNSLEGLTDDFRMKVDGFKRIN